MAFYEVFSHPVQLRYQTSVCTKATLFILVVLCLTYISPLLVAYRSQGRTIAEVNPACLCVTTLLPLSGFWMKRATYEEQPVVKFQYQTVLVAATSVGGDLVAWSTFPHLNNMLASNLRIPAISVNKQQVMQTVQGKQTFKHAFIYSGQRRGPEPRWETGPSDS